MRRRRVSAYHALRSAVLFVGTFIVLFVAIACGGEPEDVAERPTHTAPATATPDLTVTVIPGLVQELSALEGFAAEHGYPLQANVGRIRIPRIGVDAAIAARSVGPELQLGTLNPYGPADVIWYDFGSTPGYGGEPGPKTNAVLSGHVDYAYQVPYADAYYQGAGVFAGVEMLEPNDGIEVTMYGETSRYAVVWKTEAGEDFDWGALYKSEQPEGDSLTLITCTGEFDPNTQEYASRTVVRARRY